MKITKEIIREAARKEVNKILLPIPDVGRGIYSDFINENLQINLTEGIYRTYPSETSRNYIQKLFGLDDNLIRVISNNGTASEEKRLLVLYYSGYGNQERMKRAMALCGYTLSKSLPHNDGYIEEIYIPLNLPNLNEIVRKSEYITHVSPQYFKHKILKVGFVPKSINPMFSYPDRIFFFKGDTPLQEIIYQTIDFDSKNKKEHNNHKYTLYQIVTKNLPTNVNFHTDLNYPWGIYTNENIPPSCIGLHRDFDIDEMRNKFKIR